MPSPIDPRGIIANPNCSTMQMLVALAPIHRAVGIERINVATYQSVSGAGRSGMEELGRQTAALLNFQEARPDKFTQPHRLQRDSAYRRFEDNGYTREEMKMVWETRKILGGRFHPGESDRGAGAGVLRPCRGRAHRDARQADAAADARALLAGAPGVVVMDMRARMAAIRPRPDTPPGRDPVYVGRIREDISHPRGLDLWIVADNIRKGAALNAVQIAELLLANGAFARD